MTTLSSITVDIIIPTLNCASKLQLCLESIRCQSFSNYQIYIVDGGSTDQTLAVAKKFSCHILSNPLVTAEAGKAVGVKNSHSPYLAFIDSDNILPSSTWLVNMLAPFIAHPKIVGSEPWSYTYRPEGGFIERYSSLTGVNDPYALVAGNFDRLNYLSSSWTNLPVTITDYPQYQIIKLDPQRLLPTIGANGTIFRRQIFKNFNLLYLVDIDILASQNRPFYFSKVKVGIIHSYCESSILKFIRKQNRRSVDLFTYRRFRTYPLAQKNFSTSLKFILYCFAFFPILYDTIRGYIKKPDFAWFFHPVACYLTLYIYGINTLKSRFGLLRPVDRSLWQQ